MNQTALLQLIKANQFLKQIKMLFMLAKGYGTILKVFRREFSLEIHGGVLHHHHLHIYTYQNSIY